MSSNTSTSVNNSKLMPFLQQLMERTKSTRSVNRPNSGAKESANSGTKESKRGSIRPGSGAKESMKRGSESFFGNKSWAFNEDKSQSSLKQKLSTVGNNSVSSIKIKKWSATKADSSKIVKSALIESTENVPQPLFSVPVRKTSSVDVPVQFKPIALQPNRKLFKQLFCDIDDNLSSSGVSTCTTTTSATSRRGSFFHASDAPPLPPLLQNLDKRIHKKAASVNSLDPCSASSFPGHRYFQPLKEKPAPKNINYLRDESLSRRSTKSVHVVKETPRIVDNSPELDTIKLEVKKKLNVDTIQGMINRYVIVKDIGEGSFSKVYLVYNIDDDKYYACKAISKKRLRKKSLWRNGPPRNRKSLKENESLNLSKEELNRPVKKTDLMDMVRHEIAIYKRLSKHPHIATLVEVLEDNNCDMLYMVLELCEYGSLMKLNLDHPVSCLNEDLARRYFRGAVLGLEYLHFMQILHRDLKPENILLNALNNAVIGDFSISYCSQASKTESIDFEQTNGIFTPMFTPPELVDETLQTNKNGFKASIDVWGLGVTLFCFVHGKVPFHGKDIDEVYFKIVNTPTIEVLSSNLSPDLRNLLLSMLEKNPEDRITIDKIKQHSWVTRQGIDPMPSKEENCVYLLGDNGSDVDSILTQDEIDKAVIPAITTIIEKMKKLNCK